MFKAFIPPLKQRAFPLFRVKGGGLHSRPPARTFFEEMSNLPNTRNCSPAGNRTPHRLRF